MDCKIKSRQPTKPMPDLPRRGKESMFDLIKSVGGDITLDIHAGADIADVCQHMADIANRERAPVKVKFNDIELVATPGVGATFLLAQYWAESQAKSEAYKNSPKGKTTKAEMDAKIQHAREEMARLVESLPSVLSDESALMEWCASYAEHGDWTGVDCQGAYVMCQLESFACCNEHVGASPEWLQEQSTRMAKYIVGQVINCLRSGMPAHPMTITFVERYRESTTMVK